MCELEDDCKGRLNGLAMVASESVQDVVRELVCAQTVTSGHSKEQLKL